MLDPVIRLGPGGCLADGPLAGRVGVASLPLPSSSPSSCSPLRALLPELSCLLAVGLTKADRAGTHLSGGKEVLALLCVLGASLSGDLLRSRPCVTLRF